MSQEVIYSTHAIPPQCDKVTELQHSTIYGKSLEGENLHGFNNRERFTYTMF